MCLYPFLEIDALLVIGDAGSVYVGYTIIGLYFLSPSYLD